MLTLGTPFKYMIVTRELKLNFLHFLTCPQYNVGQGINLVFDPTSVIALIRTTSNKGDFCLRLREKVTVFFLFSPFRACI